MAKEQNYMGGGHRTEKFVLEGGDTAHTFLMSGTKGVGTPHNIERKPILGGGDTAHTLLGWGHRTTLTIFRAGVGGGELHPLTKYSTRIINFRLPFPNWLTIKHNLCEPVGNRCTRY